MSYPMLLAGMPASIHRAISAAWPLNGRSRYAAAAGWLESEVGSYSLRRMEFEVGESGSYSLRWMDVVPG